MQPETWFSPSLENVSLEVSRYDKNGKLSGLCETCSLLDERKLIDVLGQQVGAIAKEIANRKRKGRRLGRK